MSLLIDIRTYVEDIINVLCIDVLDVKNLDFSILVCTKKSERGILQKFLEFLKLLHLFPIGSCSERLVRLVGLLGQICHFLVLGTNLLESTHVVGILLSDLVHGLVEFFEVIDKSRYHFKDSGQRNKPHIGHKRSRNRLKTSHHGLYETLERSLYSAKCTSNGCKLGSLRASRNDSSLIKDKGKHNILDYIDKCLVVGHKNTEKADCILDRLLVLLSHLVEHQGKSILDILPHTIHSLRLPLLHLIEETSSVSDSLEDCLNILKLDHTPCNSLLHVGYRDHLMLKFCVVLREFSEQVDTSLCKLTDLCCSQIVRRLDLAVRQDEALHINSEASRHVRKTLHRAVEFLV